MRGVVDRASSILREACGDRVRVDTPMAPMTTFRVGGPAALFVEPERDEELAAVADAVSQTGIPVLVIGKGSNLLVSDRGFDGLVVRLGRGYRWARRDGARLTAGAAMPLPALSGVAFHHGLTGLEFGVAIPGSVGGAVRMNAGAHGSSMSDVVERVQAFVVSSGRSVTIPTAELAFGYRRSSLPPGSIVTTMAALLTPASREDIHERMDSARAWRRATQPLAEPSCGSVFKNPPGDHAARLVEEAGGKDRRVGGAAISAKHANFIVTSPGASASDVLTLIRIVQADVVASAGIELEPEVQLAGEFDVDAAR